MLKHSKKRGIDGLRGHNHCELARVPIVQVKSASKTMRKTLTAIPLSIRLLVQQR